MCIYVRGRRRCYEESNDVLLSWIIVLCLCQVEAENYSELSIKYEVVAVPTFILLKVCRWLTHLFLLLWQCSRGFHSLTDYTYSSLFYGQGDCAVP